MPAFKMRRPVGPASNLRLRLSARRVLSLASSSLPPRRKTRGLVHNLGASQAAVGGSEGVRKVSSLAALETAGGGQGRPRVFGSPFESTRVPGHCPRAIQPPANFGEQRSPPPIATKKKPPPRPASTFVPLPRPAAFSSSRINLAARAEPLVGREPVQGPRFSTLRTGSVANSATGSYLPQSPCRIDRGRRSRSNKGPDEPRPQIRYT